MSGGLAWDMINMRGRVIQSSLPREPGEPWRWAG